MAHTYARILWNIIEGGRQPKKAVAALHDILLQHGRAELLPHIARAFARIAAREEQKNAFTLTVAREKDRREALSGAKEVLGELGVKPSEVTARVDDSIIGGWRLEGRERLVDASFKKHLLALYNRATQS